MSNYWFGNLSFLHVDREKRQITVTPNSILCVSYTIEDCLDSTLEYFEEYYTPGDVVHTDGNKIIPAKKDIIRSIAVVGDYSSYEVTFVESCAIWKSKHYPFCRLGTKVWLVSEGQNIIAMIEAK